jgi:hypothetical protein
MACDSNSGATMRTCLSILLNKQTSGILALTVAFLGCRFAACPSTPEPVAFQNIVELKAFAEINGLYLHTGNRSNIVRDNYFVADHPITLDDLDNVQMKRNCGHTPAWRGILWACQIENQTTSLHADEIDGNWRAWGNVVVAGDEPLMNRIEELYRNK